MPWFLFQNNALEELKRKKDEAQQKISAELAQAIENNNLEIVRQFIQEDTLKNKKDHRFNAEDTTLTLPYNGMTPVFLAAKLSRDDILLEIINTGVRLEMRHDRIDSGELVDPLATKIKELIVSGALEVTTNETELLLFAVNHHDTSLLELLIIKGADINSPLITSTKYTALSKAFYPPDSDMIASIVERGGDINQTSTFGETPLYTILSNLERGDKYTFNIVKKHINKFDLTKKDDRGKTILDHAEERDLTEFANLIRSYIPETEQDDHALTTIGAVESEELCIIS
jgi:ankyrin repeat protein